VGSDTDGRHPDHPLLTIDELALTAGMTVRTTRYYASLGLLPPPVRRGRVAYYGPEHLARLQLVRALQDHGFTLAAIERYLSGVPHTSSPEELAVQRVLLTAWKPSQWEDVTRVELEARAGRRLAERDLEWLVRAGAVRRTPPGGLQVLPVVDHAVEVLDLDVPIDAIVDANAAVRRHMSALADELDDILRRQVVATYARQELSDDDARRLERTVTGLRTLALDAVVSTFQWAANQLVTRSVPSDLEDERGA
jgi:DNA-binding transcriptional MerR regulator